VLENCYCHVRGLDIYLYWELHTILAETGSSSWTSPSSSTEDHLPHSHQPFQ
jgi:hypothetical protein